MKQSMKNSLSKAVEILRAGGLVAIPTETVYGLGADAANPAALKKIFQAKQRPIDHPLIVHIGDLTKLNDWAIDIPTTAMTLAKHFWPGPLTLILHKKPGVSDLVTGGQDTIGIRIPNHPVALQLLQEFGGGIAAPSANRFGRISPTTAAAVDEELGDSVDLILEGGECEIGVESTIVDVTGETPVILRPGAITLSQLTAVLNEPVLAHATQGPRVSGALESHYAPRTKTRMLPLSHIPAFIRELPSKSRIAILSQNPMGTSSSQVQWVSMPESPAAYAHVLYQTLRQIDKQEFDQILIIKVPEGDEWVAIQDRLKKATAGVV